jgi:hypothetical protein
LSRAFGVESRELRETNCGIGMIQPRASLGGEESGVKGTDKLSLRRVGKVIRRMRIGHPNFGLCPCPQGWRHMPQEGELSPCSSSNGIPTIM